MFHAQGTDVLIDPAQVPQDQAVGVHHDLGGRGFLRTGSNARAPGFPGAASAEGCMEKRKRLFPMPSPVFIISPEKRCKPSGHFGFRIDPETPIVMIIGVVKLCNPVD